MKDEPKTQGEAEDRLMTIAVIFRLMSSFSALASAGFVYAKFGTEVAACVGFGLLSITFAIWAPRVPKGS